MVAKIDKLGEVQVRQIMQARVSIISVSTSTDYQQLLEIIRRQPTTIVSAVNVTSRQSTLLASSLLDLAWISVAVQNLHIRKECQETKESRCPQTFHSKFVKPIDCRIIQQEFVSTRSTLCIDWLVMFSSVWGSVDSDAVRMLGLILVVVRYTHSLNK